MVDILLLLTQELCGDTAVVVVVGGGGEVIAGGGNGNNVRVGKARYASYLAPLLLFLLLLLQLLLLLLLLLLLVCCLTLPIEGVGGELMITEHVGEHIKDDTSMDGGLNILPLAIGG